VLLSASLIFGLGSTFTMALALLASYWWRRAPCLRFGKSTSPLSVKQASSIELEAQRG